MTQKLNDMPNVAVLNQPRPFRVEEKDGIAKLFLHGYFDTVEDNTSLVTELYSLSEKYAIIEIWISSDGGMVTLLTEIIEALKKFQTVITICNSTASSAGAMIWSIGDLRVASPYALLMWHRESYGFYGKTNQHEDVLETQKKMFPRLMEYCNGHILTDEEKAKAMYTEVHKTGEEMIQQGFAISFEEYNARTNAAQTRFKEVGTMIHDGETGRMYMADEEGRLRVIGFIEMSKFEASFFDVGMNNTIRVRDEEGCDGAEFTQEDFENYIGDYYEDVAENIVTFAKELQEEDGEIDTADTEETVEEALDKQLDIDENTQQHTNEEEDK